MGEAAEAIAALRGKAWAVVDMKISGEVVAVPIRRLSPRMFFDIYGGLFAKLPEANGGEDAPRLLSEERPGVKDARAASGGSWDENMKAAERTVLFACVQEIGSHDQLFEQSDDLAVFSIEELTDAAGQILEFSGVTEEAGDTVRNFREGS